MQYLIAESWAELQAYRDRAPKWIKAHAHILDDWRYRTLPDATKAHLHGLWLLASQCGNAIPLEDPDFLRSRIGATDPIDLDLLTTRGFFRVGDEAAATQARADAAADPTKHARKYPGASRKTRKKPRISTSSQPIESTGDITCTNPDTNPNTHTSSNSAKMAPEMRENEKQNTSSEPLESTGVITCTLEEKRREDLSITPTPTPPISSSSPSPVPAPGQAAFGGVGGTLPLPGLIYSLGNAPESARPATNDPSGGSQGPESLLDRLLADWNAMAEAHGYPQVSKWGDGKRRQYAGQRLKNAWWRHNYRAALERIGKLKWPHGPRRGKKLGIDWFLASDTVLKVLEGVYDDYDADRAPRVVNGRNLSTTGKADPSNPFQVGGNRHE